MVYILYEKYGAAKPILGVFTSKDDLDAEVDKWVNEQVNILLNDPESGLDKHYAPDVTYAKQDVLNTIDVYEIDTLNKILD